MFPNVFVFKPLAAIAVDLATEQKHYQQTIKQYSNTRWLVFKIAGRKCFLFQIVLNPPVI